MATKDVISLLSNAKDVIEVDLGLVKASNEISRKLFFVPAGSSVETYTPAKDVSEIFISLFSMMRSEIKSLKDIPDVVGNNSPTGKHEHGIKPSQHPQAFLVIQRTATKDGWADLAESIISNKFKLWLKNLNVCGVLEKNVLSLIFSDVSKTKQIYLDVDFSANRVSYLSSSKENLEDIVDVTKSLSELKTNFRQQDLGMEK
jgi:hypothetical protein